MKELPVDPFALHARMMDALIGDILDPNATTFPRLDAMREISKQISREAGVPNKQPASNNGQ